MTGLIKRNNGHTDNFLTRTNSIFDSFFNDPLLNSFGMDMYTNKDVKIRKSDEGKKRLEIPLAGYNKDDIDLSIQGNKLIVTAEKHDEEYKVNDLYSYSCTINPDTIDIENAVFKNGMLYIILNEKEETFKRKIEIE